MDSQNSKRRRKMINKLEIHGIHYSVDENLQKYISRKINRLEKYVAVDARQSFHVEVFMQEIKARSGKQCECEIVVHLPKEILTVKDSTVNMYAAIDIVEEKLKQALKKYKNQHDNARKERHLLNRSHLEV